MTDIKESQIPTISESKLDFKSKTESESKLESKLESHWYDIPPPSLHEMLNEQHLYLHSKDEKCVYNQYGQCIKGFRYFCAYCNYGLGGMFSSCYNNKCDVPKNELQHLNATFSDFQLHT